MDFIRKALLIALLFFLLWWRLQVSMTRFFDVDEFSYMHWAAAVARGEHLYTDIFSYFTPGFFWVFSPLFVIMGKTAQVLMAGRIVSYGIFLGILGGLGYLWGITRGWKWALLPVCILAFLPMPYDKYLEIRPDNLSALCALLGVIFQVLALRKHSGRWWLVSGLLYSASLFVLTKTLPLIAVGAGIALLTRGRKAFFGGLFGPWIVFFLGSVIAGNFGTVWYSLTRLPFEVYKSTAGWSMEPDLFFFPNASFYGGTGYAWTWGLVLNNILWVIAGIWGVYRLFSWDRKQFLTELLIGLALFVQVYGYVKYFPAKHSQYLIPIAIFVAYYAADAASAVFEWFGRIGGRATLAIVLAAFSLALALTTISVNRPKLAFTNTVQKQELAMLIRTIPPQARVVDLEGMMLYWRDGYPVSALPIDSTLSFVTRRPPVLAAYLREHPAQFIWNGDSGRLTTLSPVNQDFIRTQYEAVAGWGERLYALRTLQ